MDNNILVAVITGLIAGASSIITTVITSRNSDIIQTEQIKVIQQEITKLSNKVEQHNNYGLEIADLKARVTNLERKV